MCPKLLTKDFLAERHVPELEPETVQYFDHIRRYLFAQQFVSQRIVLDVACGTGYGSDMLRLAGATRVISMDISRETLAYAARQWGAADLVEGDAQRLPMQSACVDVIVSFETLEHLPDPRRFLSEAARVLKPEGDLILSAPNREFASPGSATPFSPYHAFEPTYAELRALLEGAGWTILTMHGLVHSKRVAAILPTPTGPYSRTGKQTAWGAYVRRWIRYMLPGLLYEWQGRIRRIPQISIADSILTECATETSPYFVVHCRR